MDKSFESWREGSDGVAGMSQSSYVSKDSRDRSLHDRTEEGSTRSWEEDHDGGSGFEASPTGVEGRASDYSVSHASRGVDVGDGEDSFESWDSRKPDMAERSDRSRASFASEGSKERPTSDRVSEYSDRTRSSRHDDDMDKSFESWREASDGVAGMSQSSYVSKGESAGSWKEDSDEGSDFRDSPAGSKERLDHSISHTSRFDHAGDNFDNGEDSFDSWRSESEHITRASGEIRRSERSGGIGEEDSYGPKEDMHGPSDPQESPAGMEFNIADHARLPFSSNRDDEEFSFSSGRNVKEICSEGSQGAPRLEKGPSVSWREDNEDSPTGSERMSNHSLSVRSNRFGNVIDMSESFHEEQHDDEAIGLSCGSRSKTLLRGRADEDFFRSSSNVDREVSESIAISEDTKLSPSTLVPGTNGVDAGEAADGSWDEDRPLSDRVDEDSDRSWRDENDLRNDFVKRKTGSVQKRSDHSRSGTSGRYGDVEEDSFESWQEKHDAALDRSRGSPGSFGGDGEEDLYRSWQEDDGGQSVTGGSGSSSGRDVPLRVDADPRVAVHSGATSAESDSPEEDIETSNCKRNSSDEKPSHPSRNSIGSSMTSGSWNIASQPVSSVSNMGLVTNQSLASWESGFSGGMSSEQR